MLASQTRLDLRSAKVLIVDDNQQSLDLISQILMGFRVGKTETCRSAADARKLVSGQRYDLLIVDAEMPDEDGVAFTRTLRRQSDLPNFTVPVILVSSHTPFQNVERARDAGANLVVRKPIAPATLLNRIVWLARNSRQFVSSEGYCGPDRRFRKGPPPEDVGERRADALALENNLDRSMSQNEVDAIFG